MSSYCEISDDKRVHLKYTDCTKNPRLSDLKDDDYITNQTENVIKDTGHKFSQEPIDVCACSFHELEDACTMNQSETPNINSERKSKMEVKGRFTIIDLSPESPDSVSMRKRHGTEFEEPNTVPSIPCCSDNGMAYSMASLDEESCANPSLYRPCNPSYSKVASRSCTKQHRALLRKDSPISYAGSGASSLESHASTAESSEYWVNAHNSQDHTVSEIPMRPGEELHPAQSPYCLENLQSECYEMKRDVQGMIANNACFINKMYLPPKPKIGKERRAPSSDSEDMFSRQMLFEEVDSLQIQHDTLQLAHNVLQAQYEQVTYSNKQLKLQVNTLLRRLAQEMHSKEKLRAELEQFTANNDFARRERVRSSDDYSESADTKTTTMCKEKLRSSNDLAYGRRGCSGNAQTLEYASQHRMEHRPKSFVVERRHLRTEYEEAAQGMEVYSACHRQEASNQANH